MSSQFSISENPPWDQVGWLILDAPSFLANVEKAGAADALLDLRSPLLEKVWRGLEGDLRRLGCRGYLSGKPLFGPFDPSEPEGWEKVLAPPFPASRLEDALRAGFTVVVGHSSEAIILSNAAQSLERRCPVLIRLRNPDLMADPGQTSFLTILEIFPQRPMLELAGFFFDQPFATRQDCDTFSRAVARCLGETRALCFIGGESGPQLQRLLSRKCLGPRLLGLSETAGGEVCQATLTLEAWGIPLEARERKLLIGVEIGHARGIPRKAALQLFVEGIPARIVRVEDWRLIIEIVDRPDVPPPWRVLLLGASTVAGTAGPISSVVPGDWPAESLWPMLESLSLDLPLLFRSA